jgi:hypothetical protein
MFYLGMTGEAAAGSAATCLLRHTLACADAPDIRMGKPVLNCHS